MTPLPLTKAACYSTAHGSWLIIVRFNVAVSGEAVGWGETSVSE